MPVYRWSGTNRAGKKIKGEMEAPDAEVLAQILRRQRIQPLKIKEAPKDLLANVTFLQPKVKEKDIVIFTRQFATMIDAGLPLVQCLEILAGQITNRTFKQMLKQIKADVESGSTFADALKKHPKTFDELFVNLIAAGEVGGILDTILNRLSAYIEKTMKLKKKVKGAMVYPVVVLVISIAVVTVLLVFVIPVFQKLFADMGGALPGPTQLVVNFSGWVRKYIVLILGLIVLFIILLNRFYNTRRGRVVIDDLLLKLPVLGDLVRKVAVARFTRTLGTMIQSGVPLLDGLDIVAKTAGNKTIETAIFKTRASIAEGRTIAEPLNESGVFPPMVVQMIAVGESTGALDAMLAKIADFYDEEVDAAVEALTSLIEPFMMIFLGGVIGGLVISMYLPIFQIAGTIK
jgi:type IV pilus assembly protein PilC